jgi:hypothetical protein
MKSYKLFTEAKKDEPKIGDYVTVTTKGERLDPYAPDELESFFNNNIGRIDRIEPHLSPNLRVCYKDIKIPKGYEYSFYWDRPNFRVEHSKDIDFVTWISSSNIIDIAETKKELELKIIAQKYNL